MSKVFIKIKSADFDHKANKTHVKYHTWDGKYFCAECALKVNDIYLDGVNYNSPEDIKSAILKRNYGHN